MNVDDLLKVLRDAGLDDEGIKALLTEALNSLEGNEEEVKPEADLENAEDEAKAAASDLLGVSL